MNFEYRSGWVKLELVENTSLNQVTLYLRMIPALSEKSAEKSAESAEKSAEKQEVLLSERQRQILECMELEVLYKTEEIAEKIGLKGARTRELLNELVAMRRLTCTAATKNRRYISRQVKIKNIRRNYLNHILTKMDKIYISTMEMII